MKFSKVLKRYTLLPSLTPAAISIETTNDGARCRPAWQWIKMGRFARSALKNTLAIVGSQPENVDLASSLRFTRVYRSIPSGT